jgi:glycosyltransferase involved in cell wall biosynthesis
MRQPLVSVICLCHNHERFLPEAIESVRKQTYDNLEIIVVDDASTDGSKEQIRGILQQDPSISFLSLSENLGNCAAFNAGLALARGEFVVDFSTDDVMMPDRITEQVRLFHSLDETYGVVFTDVEYINEAGEHLYYHYEYLRKKRLINSIPQGDVYADILSTYFVSSPSMLVRRNVFDDLNGYDPNLAYEDFDFWVRSSRKYKYAYLNKVLTKVRKHEKSLSKKQYIKGSRQLHSTYLVCRKAQLMNKTENENKALIRRLRYELRHAILTHHVEESKLFFDMLRELSGAGLIEWLLWFLRKLPIPLSNLRSAYQRVRYGT